MKIYKTGMMGLMMLFVVVQVLAKDVSGPYFGQTPPGSTPTVFAQGIINNPGISVIRVAFSPDGNECFFTKSSPENTGPWYIYYTQRINDVWTTPALAPFPQQGTFTGQPFFSNDGNKLYYTANGTIQVVERTKEGWGNPRTLDTPINVEDGNTVYYSKTQDGTVYFASNRPGGKGKLDIWRSRQMTGQPLEVENLGSPFNTSDFDYDPYVAPNGQYFLFARAGSIFVSFSNGKGGWKTPIDMNVLVPGFNVDYSDGPSISPDGKYLFWRRISPGGQHVIYWIENPVPGYQKSEDQSS